MDTGPPGDAASWTYLLPRPRVGILGMMKREIPLFSIHPAIPPSRKMFHLLVLVTGKRLVLFPWISPVRILSLVLAIRTLMSDGSQTAGRAHH